MAKAYFIERVENGVFNLDFSNFIECKGIYSIEVKPLSSSGVVLENDIEKFTHEKPFKLESPVPMINGFLKFKSDSDFIVRMVVSV